MLIVTGVGGTGVVTVGALLGMAAHLENKGVTTLDQTGLAQKGGAVMSHIQIAATPGEIHATRIATGEAEVIIGCDEIVSASADALSRVRLGFTSGVINNSRLPTAEFLSDPDWRYPNTTIEKDLVAALGEGCTFVPANALAVAVLGDSIFANPLMLGFAWQKGWLPVSKAALLRAIELNGVAVENNKAAFEWGRVAAHDPGLLPVPENTLQAVKLHEPENLDDVVHKRVELLTAYQNRAYGELYLNRVNAIADVEGRLGSSRQLTLAVAKNLAKLMAYKDEYEVARLHSSPLFMDQLRQQFEGEPGVDYEINYHLAPPLLSKRDINGHLVKSKYGQWMGSAFKLMSRLKGLRGSVFDIFGKTEERKQEKALVADYLDMLDEFARKLSAENLETAIQLASLPEKIRGFGHIKEKNMVAAAAQRQKLLEQFRAGR